MSSEPGSSWVFRGFTGAPIVAAIYLVGLLCLVFPPVDLLANVWPLRLGDVQWRYGAVGLGSGFLLTPLLGLALLGALATVQSRAGVLRAVGVVGLGLGLFLLCADLLFVLDALQVRTGVEEGDRWFFRVAALRASGKVLLGALAFGALGLGALRTRSWVRKPRDRSEREKEGILLR